MREQPSPTRFLGSFADAAAHGPLPAGSWVLARAELLRRRALRKLGFRRRFAEKTHDDQNETL